MNADPLETYATAAKKLNKKPRQADLFKATDTIRIRYANNNKAVSNWKASSFPVHFRN
jgi:hypothetical protein